MISGLNSSSVMGAIRTAGQARETRDTMTRQIATGQRVASVKDDGAAYVRAAGIKSQVATTEARTDVLGRLDMHLAYTDAVLHQAIAGLDRLRELTIAARAYAPGSSQRAALQAEWTQTLTSSNQGGANPDFVHSAAHWDEADFNNFGYDLSAMDPMFASNRWALIPSGAAFSSWYNMGFPVMLSSVNLTTATDADLTDAFASATFIRDQARGRWGVSVGQDQRLVDRLRSTNSAEADRLTAAASALTDADLGKASTQLRAAETRQQLALSTVREAISAYGNFASGLLGNVQRTQRGIMA